MWFFYIGVVIFIAGARAEDKSVTVGNFTTKVKGQSGKIAIYRNMNESDGVTVTFDALEEIDKDGSKIQTHSYQNFAQLTFTFSSPENTTYKNSNVTVTQFNFSSTIPFGDKTATLTSYVYIFTADGNITVDGKDFEVKYGDMKFDAKIKNWPFCNTTGVSCTQGQKTYAGEYLDFSVEIKGKKSADNSSNSGGEFDLGDGDTVVIPKMVKYDNATEENMPTGYPKLEVKDPKTVFVFRFKRFNSSALYDPIVSLASTGGGSAGGDNSTGGSTSDTEISASGISAKVLGKSGKIELMNAGSTSDSGKNKIVVEFDNLQEMTSAGSAVKDSNHNFNTFASQTFTFGNLTDETYPNTNIGVRRLTFQSTLKNGAMLKVDIYFFKVNGEIKQENETTEVKAGNVKFNVEITSWKFCNGTATCQPSETGQYLDFDIVIKGTGSTKKQSGETYDLGSGKVMLSRKIKVDDAADLQDMMTGYPQSLTVGSKQVFRFRFPKFSSKVVYDPTMEVYPDSGCGPTGSGSVMVVMTTILLAIMCTLLQLF